MHLGGEEADVGAQLDDLEEGVATQRVEVLELAPHLLYRLHVLVGVGPLHADLVLSDTSASLPVPLELLLSHVPLHLHLQVWVLAGHEQLGEVRPPQQLLEHYFAVQR